jgi:hypothetical protein
MFNKRSVWLGGLALVIVALAGIFLRERIFRPSLVITYPNPGDLSRVEGLKPSQAFTVQVNDTPVFVYETLQGWSFFSFALQNTTVRVTVTANREIRDWKVRPAALGITPQHEGRNFTFTLSRPQKLVLQINGPNGLKLLISGEPPETEVSAADAPDTLFFGPGVHRVGYRYVPPSNIRTIYLAGGAVVEGTLRIKGRRNLKIIGRGILSMGEWPHAEQEGMNLQNNDGLLIDGITSVNSPGWQIMIGGSNWAKIRNVKLLATKEHGNTDGIQTWNQHTVRVEDVFIRANDDSFAINHGTVYFIARNGILWNDTNGASFMLGWGGEQDSHDIRYENMDVLENGSRAAGVFSARWGGQRQATISGVTYSNIRVENATTASGVPVKMFDMVTGKKSLESRNSR